MVQHYNLCLDCVSHNLHSLESGVSFFTESQVKIKKEEEEDGKEEANIGALDTLGQLVSKPRNDTFEIRL